MPSPLYWISTIKHVSSFCIFGLWVKMFATIMIGATKASATKNRTSEDEKFMKNDEVSSTDIEAEKRYWAIEISDLETIPFASLLFYGAMGAAFREDHFLALIIMLPLFSFVRFLHTFSYAHSSYGFAKFCHISSLLLMAAMGVSAFAFNIDRLVNIGF